MKSAWAVLSALLVPALVMVSSADAQSRLIRVKGANIMAGPCDEWAHQFMEKNPGATVVVQGGGTPAGFEALFDKSTDLVMASRKILEKEAQSAALHAVKTGESMVAESAVAFVTHPDNPVKALTLEQLRKICLGEITTWADVGGPSEPIQVITTLPDSGTFTFLRFTLLDEGYFLSESKSKQYFRDIIREIAGRKPPSLGYVGMDDAIKAARNGFVRILALKKDADSPAVLPSPTTVRDRSYPIVQPLYFYWDEKRAPDVIQKFVDFCRKLNEAAKK